MSIIQPISHSIRSFFKGLVLCASAIILMAASTATAQEEYRIAVLLPLTGKYAVFGQLQSQGYKLAEARLSRGRNFKVRYFDLSDNWDLELQALVKEQVLPWKPDLILGPYSSSRAVEVIELVKQSRIPLLIPTATLDSLTTNSKNTNIFRLAPPSGMLAEVALNFVQNKEASGAIERIVILAENSAFSQGFVDSLKVAAMKNRMSIGQVVSYPPGKLDSHRAQLQVTEKTAVLAISRSVSDCQVITDEYASRTLLVGLTAGFFTREYRAYLQRTGIQQVVVSPWHKDMSNPVVANFCDDFSNMYRDAFSDARPQYHSAEAYSAMLVAVDALDRTNEATTLQSALEATNIESPLGKIQFVNFAGYYRQSIIPPVVWKFNGKSFDVVSDSTGQAVVVAKPKSEGPSLIKILLNNQLIALFVILALGLTLGRITIGGLSLGTAGVLFVALVVGHFHLTIPAEIGSFGLVLFIYSVGVGAGPNFFKSFADQGIQLAKLSIFTVLIGGIITVLLVKAFNVPLDLAIGLFAGALTSTPALAAGIDALRDFGDLVPVGYGIAYPFGVIGVVIFVQLLPKLLKVELDQLDDQSGGPSDDKKIRRRVVGITSESIVGKKLGEVELLNHGDCVVSRIIKDAMPMPAKFDTVLEKGMQLLLIGPRRSLDSTTALIGETLKTNYVLDIEQQQMKVIVTSRNVARKRLKDIETLRNFGVVISRVTRHSAQFVPRGDTLIEEYDILTAVGEKQDLDMFAAFAGHQEKALEQTDVFKICLAIILGILVGSFPIVMPNGKMISLGLAGGPLFVALILSYFRKVGYIPPASRALLQKLGLMLFLANAGVSAGSRLVPTIQEHGVSLFIMGMVLTLTPMAVTFVVAYYFMKMNLLEVLGGVCGGMTSTPALGAISSKTDSIRPLTSYAVAYPVALILMTVLVQIIASVFSR